MLKCSTEVPHLSRVTARGSAGVPRPSRLAEVPLPNRVVARGSTWVARPSSVWTRGTVVEGALGDG